MRGLPVFLMTLTLALTHSQTHAFDLKESATRSVSDGTLLMGDVENLANSISSKLGVNVQQAAGGSAALLAMAKNQMSLKQFETITETVPSLSSLMNGSGGLPASPLNQITSMEGVANAFTTLGMNSNMIGQFAPILLEFLGEEGLSASLLTQLQGIWGAAS